MTAGPFGVPVAARERPPVRRRRSPVRLVLTLLLFVVVMLVIGFVIERAGAKTQVLVLAQRVVQAQEITRADLTSTDLSGGVSAISVDQLEQVLGQHAAFTMEAGTLLQPTSLIGQDAANAGQSSVGISVPVGLVPEGLRAGDTVRVMQIPEPENASNDQTLAGLSPGTVVADGALITAVSEEPTSAGNLVITVRVPTDVSGPLLVASSWGQVGLIRVGGA